MTSRVDILRSDVNGITWIALDGELDMAGANEAGPELMAVCDGAAHAVLDTRAVRFIDLAGLRVLFALRQRQQRRGARLSIVPGHQVRHLAELAGMTELLQGAATPDELLGLTDGSPPPRGARQPDLARTRDLCDHVAAQVLRQRRLVERMLSLSAAATSLLDELRGVNRAAADRRADRAAHG